MSSPVLSISQGISKKVPGLHLSTHSLIGITVTRTSESILESKKKLLASFKGKTFDDIKDLPTFKAYRKIHDQIGTYPDNTPPAVENLYTRGILQGKFPTINNVVDACNIVSVISQIPIGVFDSDKITGNINLRLSTEGDEFTPIGKTKPSKITKGVPILQDEVRIISIPGVRDSNETKITKHTKNLLLISWGIKEIPADMLETVLEEAAHIIKCRN